MFNNTEKRFMFVSFLQRICDRYDVATLEGPIVYYYYELWYYDIFNVVYNLISPKIASNYTTIE